MTGDDDVQWAPWMRRIPRRYRRVVAAALVIAVIVGARLTGLRDWLGEQPVIWVAIPLVLVGLWALVVGCGPRRWVERERKKARRAPLRPGVRLLGKMSVPVTRAFFIVFGGGVITLAVMAVREAG